MEHGQQRQDNNEFSAAEIGALAHLYRGEVYRSAIWRTRLDNTTNWAVVTTGIAFSIVFSRAETSPLPLILVGILSVVFLIFEARRYRFFISSNARAQYIERQLYAPMLRGQETRRDGEWNEVLASDYVMPAYHISITRAIAQRLRKNYSWLFSVQAIAYYGKISIHPTSLTSFDEFFMRSSIGPVSGMMVLSMSVIFHVSWIALVLTTLVQDRRKRLQRQTIEGLGSR